MGRSEKHMQLGETKGTHKKKRKTENRLPGQVSQHLPTSKREKQWVLCCVCRQGKRILFEYLSVSHKDRRNTELHTPEFEQSLFSNRDLHVVFLIYHLRKSL